MTPSTDFTSLAAAQANQLQSSQVMIAGLNGNLTFIYMTAFNNWKISVDAGRISNANPPLPPTGYVIGPADKNGFQYPEMGTDPVCAMPAIPEDHFTPPVKVANTFDVGHRIGGSWFSVGPSDTVAGGFKTPPTTSSDGVFGVFEKYSAPVGAGWYLLS